MTKTLKNASKSKRNSTLDNPSGETIYKYVKHQKLLLKTHPDFNEKWVQEKIAEDPSILGIGELILKDQERNQPGAGRLDLLFQDPDSNLRYEVEIQLGKTDECHIFRTIEYWDLERKRYPQYDHVAVLIAEDITSRFLNIISLLNGFIPLVAIQLNAIQIADQIALIFTVVLDHRLGLAPDEEEEQEVTDRTYWERRSSKTTVSMADEVLRLLKTLDHELALKYNKFYISVSKDNKPFNFVIFRPKKTSLRVEPKLKKAEEIEIMPRFPKTVGMSREEKFTSVTIYLSKVIDHLQGNEDEHTIYPHVRRQDFHSSGSRSLPENLKVEDLLSGISQADPSLEVGEKREDPAVGPSEVAGTSD